MIVPMKKVFVVGRTDRRESLVEALRGVGVLHLVPVDVAKVGADVQLTRALERVERGLGALAAAGPASPGAPVELEPEALADEAVALQKARGELAARLAAIEGELEALAEWGELRLEDVQRVRGAGLHLEFARVDEAEVAAVRADLVERLGTSGGKALLGLASRRGVELPPSAEVLELPAADRPTLRAEAARLARQQEEGAARIAALGRSRGALEARAAQLRSDVDSARVSSGALTEGVLFGLQGWLPADRLPALDQAVEGLAGVSARDPLEDEQPPTLLRPPVWARPISGLMDILGLNPGYREADVSAAFMVALPIFAAMLISDAGYGLLLFLAPLLFWRRATATLGKPLAQFVVVLGAASVIWGALTGSAFGFDVARLLGGAPLIAVSQDDSAIRPLMRLSFTIGVVHLSFAQVWRALLLWPHPSAFGRLGWATFLWGMYGVVTMFVLRTEWGWHTPWPWLLSAGAALAVFFSSPGGGVIKTFFSGLANFPLTAMGTFSDIMSYVRLMAVGLAGSVLAVSFNEMAASAGWVMGVPIFVLGHALNIGLCLIALFAHGVRLNVLEFSNNFGLEWGGYPYQPFTRQPGATVAPSELAQQGS